MSDTGLKAFDKTLQITHVWLDDLMEETLQDKQTAWHLLSATLRTLRDRLPADLAAHLGEQLPMLLRGAFYEQYDPANQPKRLQSEEEFVQHVQAMPAAPDRVDAEAVTAVLRVLSQHVDSGLVEKLRQSLPKEIRPLWPDV